MPSRKKKKKIRNKLGNVGTPYVLRNNSGALDTFCLIISTETWFEF
jgi:hypothetical protein